MVEDVQRALNHAGALVGCEAGNDCVEGDGRGSQRGAGGIEVHMGMGEERYRLQARDPG